VRVAGQLLWSVAINVAALFVASIFISGIDYGSDFGTLILAGIVFGLVNFFINILMLYITSWIVSGFNIDKFSDAIWATIIIWLVNVVFHGVIGFDDRRRR
jgi:uncharacterized membrane protein YvlD (DUF360 family)